MTSARDVMALSRHFLMDQDGAVAVFKVALDESGTHDDSPVVVVAGYLAKPPEWRDWTKKWNLVKRPIRIFHAVDCQNLKGEFKGWKPDERDAYVRNLLPVIAAAPLAGIVTGIDKAAFNAAMQDHPDLRRMFGNTYTACFQWAVQHILAIAHRYQNTDRVAFVHEINNMKGDAVSALDFIGTYHNPGKNKITLSFAGKDDFVPLQAADILAYEGNKRLRNLSGKPRRSWDALKPEDKILVFFHDAEAMPKAIKFLEDIRDGKVPVMDQFLAPGDVDRFFPERGRGEPL